MALNEIVSDHPISWTMSYFDFTVFSSILHGKIPDVDMFGMLPARKLHIYLK